MTTFAGLINKMFLRVPQCPAALMNDALLTSLYNFLRDSEAYTTTLTLDLVADQAAYTLSSETDFDIVKIEWVKQSDSEISADKWSFTRPATLTLDEAPGSAETDGLDVRVVLTTRDSSDTSSVPSQIFDRYCDAIVSGALVEIHMLPGRPWTNAELAGYHRQRYLSGITDSLNDKNRRLKLTMVRNNVKNTD